MALRTLVKETALRRGLGFQHTRGLKSLSLPDLPYDYDALEPVIGTEIMQLHHRKHHQTYVSNYNKALEQLDAAMDKGDAPTVVKLQSAIKFNGGGGGEAPKGSLVLAVESHFGSLAALIKKMIAQGAALQGSRWVWLALDKELKCLAIETTANQYKKDKQDYLKSIWMVMNWNYASEVYEKECA